MHAAISSNIKRRMKLVRQASIDLTKEVSNLFKHFIIDRDVSGSDKTEN